MRGFLAVFIAITKNWMRSKTGVFFSFLFPVMLLLVFGTIFGEHEVKYTLYVQNLDIKDGKETNLSKYFIEALNSTFNVKRIADVDVFELANPMVKRVLIIPKGFERETLNKSIYVRIGVIADIFAKLMEKYGEYINESAKRNITRGQKMLSVWKNKTRNETSAEIILLADENDPSYPVVYGILRSVTSAFNNKLIGAEDVINITTKPTTRLRMADYYLSGYIAAFIMTNGIIGVTSTVSEYRRNGTLKRLAATPLSKTSWIMANIAQQTLLAVLLTLLMVFLGKFIFNTQEIPNVFAWLLIFVGAITFCSIGMVLGGIIKDVEAATGLGNAIAFPMMFLSGAFWPVEIMPDYMQSIAKILPLYYFHQGLRSIMTFNTLDLTSYMVLGTLAAIFIPLAVKVTKWRELG